MGEGIRRNLPFWIDGGVIMLLLLMIWNTSAWKAQVQEQMQQHREQIAQLAMQRISPEADRRLSVVERDGENRSREIAEMKADLVRRLERIDAKLDRLAE